MDLMTEFDTYLFDNTGGGTELSSEEDRRIFRAGGRSKCPEKEERLSNN